LIRAFTRHEQKGGKVEKKKVDSDKTKIEWIGEKPKPVEGCLVATFFGIPVTVKKEK